MLAIAHHGAVSPLRGLELGKPYVPPPAPPGLTPTPESLAPGSLRGALTPPGSTGSDGNAAAGEARDGGARGRPPTLVAALTRAFCGMSPRVAREVCWAAGVDSAATAAALGPAEWEALSGALERWRVAVTSGDFLAGALVPEGGFTVLGFLHGDRHRDTRHEAPLWSRFCGCAARLCCVDCAAPAQLCPLSRGVMQGPPPPQGPMRVPGSRRCRVQTARC